MSSLWPARPKCSPAVGKFRTDALARKAPKRAWQKLSSWRGAKGQRFCDWVVVDLAEPAPGRHQLLVRRNRSTGELAHYRCHSATPASLATLVKVAGSRWRVEETFQSGKGAGRAGRFMTKAPTCPAPQRPVAEGLHAAVGKHSPTADKKELQRTGNLRREHVNVQRPGKAPGQRYRTPGLLVLSSLARRSVCRISLFAPLTSLPLVLCALGALSAWSGCGR